jgi:predicted SprT family Zn-dependent metalloprotease
LHIKNNTYTFASSNQNDMDLFKAQTLAKQLIEQHGLKQHGWIFAFDNARRRFGCCNYRSRRITLSKHLVELNDEYKVKNTILHEIAHALTPGHHHDWVWKRKALEIGCDGNRCYSGKVVSTPESKYIAVCKGCNHTHKKHRKPTRTSSCGTCSGGRYNPTYQLNFVLNPKYPH